MPRGKSPTHAVPQTRNPTVSTVAASGSDDSVPSVSRVPSNEGRKGTALEALQTIYTYDEGWQRTVSQNHGELVYFKYKWSRGPYAGGYVMYRCDDLDYTAALWGLLRKIEAVYAGTLRPTPDHPYE